MRLKRIRKGKTIGMHSAPNETNISLRSNFVPHKFHFNFLQLRRLIFFLTLAQFFLEDTSQAKHQY